MNNEPEEPTEEPPPAPKTPWKDWNSRVCCATTYNQEHLNDCPNNILRKYVQRQRAIEPRTCCGTTEYEPHMKDCFWTMTYNQRQKLLVPLEDQDFYNSNRVRSVHDRASHQVGYTEQRLLDATVTGLERKVVERLLRRLKAQAGGQGQSSPESPPNAPKNTGKKAHSSGHNPSSDTLFGVPVVLDGSLAFNHVVVLLEHEHLVYYQPSRFLVAKNLHDEARSDLLLDAQARHRWHSWFDHMRAVISTQRHDQFTKNQPPHVRFEFMVMNDRTVRLVFSWPDLNRTVQTSRINRTDQPERWVF